MRALCVLSSILMLVPAAAGAQSFKPSVSIQAAAGPTLIDRGSHVSAAAGFSPISRVTLFVEVQRTQLSSRTTRSDHGSSVFRGGTITAVSGEVRVGLWPVDRVTPFLVAGFGAGTSRPTVNADFPNPVTNDVRFVNVGGGVHVPLRHRLSLFGDARLHIGEEANELFVISPLRAGIAWRF